MLSAASVCLFVCEQDYLKNTKNRFLWSFVTDCWCESIDDTGWTCQAASRSWSSNVCGIAVPFGALHISMEGHRQLYSTTRRLLYTSRYTLKTYDRPAFASADPSAMEFASRSSIRSPGLTIDNFERSLKTFLFERMAHALETFIVVITPHTSLYFLLFTFYRNVLNSDHIRTCVIWQISPCFLSSRLMKSLPSLFLLNKQCVTDPVPTHLLRTTSMRWCHSLQNTELVNSPLSWLVSSAR